MLEKIKLKNFRIHSYLVVKFSPRITTIVGANRSGKSTILRALEWVGFDRPLGSSFIKHGKDKATVKLLTDGKKITRSKGKGVNSYKIDKQKFEAFRGDVPSEVAKLLNISDINFQNQHDSPFWLSETAGAVSRQLNKIVNLDVIDKILYNLAARIRKAKMEIGIVRDRWKEAKQQKKKLAFVKEMDGDLTAIEQLADGIQRTALKASTIRKLIELGIKYRQARENASIAVIEGKNAVLKGKTYQNISSKCSNLRSLIELAKKNDSSIKQSRKECREAKQQFEKEMGKGCPIYQCACPLKKK